MFLVSEYKPLLLLHFLLFSIYFLIDNKSRDYYLYDHVSIYQRKNQQAVAPYSVVRLAICTANVHMSSIV